MPNTGYGRRSGPNRVSGPRRSTGVASSGQSTNGKVKVKVKDSSPNLIFNPIPVRESDRSQTEKVTLMRYAHKSHQTGYDKVQTVCIPSTILQQTKV